MRKKETGSDRRGAAEPGRYVMKDRGSFVVFRSRSGRAMLHACCYGWMKAR